MPKRFLPQLGVVGLLSLTFTQAIAVPPVLNSVYLSRGEEDVQTDATTVIPDPRPTGPTYGGPLNWGVEIQGTALSAPTITLPGVTNNSTLNPSQHNGGVLGFNSGDGSWEYGSPNFSNIGFPVVGGAADRNARFPVGTYTISIPRLTDVVLNYQHSVPGVDQLVFTLSGGSWSGGSYYFNPTQPLVISTQANPFTAFNANVNGAIGMSIHDGSFNLVSGSDMPTFYSDNPSGPNYINETVPGGVMTAGQTYILHGSYIAIVDQNTTNGSTNFAFFNGATEVTLVAIPEPSTYVAFAGVGVLIFAALRRRRAAA